ncbi:hypothetical protein [Roseovarius sp.]|jgi:hypothetical protein
MTLWKGLGMRWLQDYMMVMTMAVAIAIGVAGLSSLGLQILKSDFADAVSSLSKER